MILDDLTAAVAKRLVEDKERVSISDMKERALLREKQRFLFEMKLNKPRAFPLSAK